MVGQYLLSYPFKSNETPESMIGRFRSSMPPSKNVTVTPQASPLTKLIREKAPPFITDQTTNSVQQLSYDRVLMHDHVIALTKLTEDALRLIIPFPHFKGWHDFTTLVNEEIKKTASGDISADESSRVILGLRKMLCHYEDEAELVSIDALEDHPCTNSHHCDNAPEIGMSKPKGPPNRYPVHEFPKTTNGSPEYQCAAINTAIQDLVNLRDAAIEHAKQHSYDFGLIITQLGTAIDLSRRAHLGRMTSLERILEVKYLVQDKEYYIGKLVTVIEAACPLLSSHRGQKDDAHQKPSMSNGILTINNATSQRERLQIVNDKNQELQLQKTELESQVRTLETEKCGLNIEMKELEDQYQRLEAENMALEAIMRGALDEPHDEANLKIEFDVVIRKLKCENEELRSKITHLEVKAKEQLKHVNGDVAILKCAGSV